MRKVALLSRRSSFLGGILFLAAVVLALASAFESENSSSNRTEAVSVKDVEPQFPYLRSVAAISLGAPVTSENVEIFFSSARPEPNVLTTDGNLEGRLALKDIEPFTPITTENSTSDPARLGLAHFVPEGMRAVALRVTDEIAVGNFIRPGDYVDINVVMRPETLPSMNKVGEKAERLSEPHSYVLMQNLRVLTVGPSYGDDAEDIHDYRNVTLALTPQQVSSLTLARNLGTYYLSLRNPDDKNVSSSSRVVASELSKLHLDNEISPSKSRGVRVVEIINGTSRQTVEVGTDG